MVFGGIWAYLAWGTYWLWTPKELWTVILWLFYSLYLHARLRQWWQGKPAAALGVLGFIIVMFTYLGVSLFMKSSHTF
jgi:ABC-type transport system involved in cytochrome c biogenesis permease subunit